MAVIAIKAFRGEVPRFSERLLQGNQAQRAWNCRITSGRLDPVLGPSLAATSGLAGAVKTMFRYRHFVNGVPTENWLVWDTDADVVLSPLANEARGTFYYTSKDFDPRVSNYELAINGLIYPDAWYALGVPNPRVAPTVAPSGGTAPAENRSYAYTFVTQWGEESGPSPASAVASGNINGTWELSNLQAAPPNSGTVSAALADTPVSGQVRVTLDNVFGLAAHERISFASVLGMTDLNGTHRIVSVDAVNNRVVIALATAQVYTSGGTWAREAPLNTTGMVKRIYRTAGTSPAFLFVAEIPVATTTFNDNVAPSNLAEVLPTAATLPPPKNLTSLLSLPNGCLVGLSGNEVCFSDPYMPYSWPQSNRYSFSGIGVALVKAGNSVIVLTNGFPILFTGTDPEAMSPTTIETYAPCVSTRGVVDVGGGALYPSFDGLWLVSPGGAKKITQNLFRDKEWKAMNPSSFQAAFYDGQYFANRQVDENTGRLFILDVSEPDSITNVDDEVDAIYRNEMDGKLYVSKGRDIYEWDADDGFRYEADWQSREYQMARPTTMAWAQVFAKFDDIIPSDAGQQAINQALIEEPMMARGQLLGAEILQTEINASLIKSVVAQAQRRVQFTLYREGVPIFTKTVASNKPFPLKTGYKAELFSVGLAPSVPVYSVAVASSIEELREVAP